MDATLTAEMLSSSAFPMTSGCDLSEPSYRNEGLKPHLPSFGVRKIEASSPRKPIRKRSDDSTRIEVPVARSPSRSFCFRDLVTASDPSDIDSRVQAKTPDESQFTMSPRSPRGPLKKLGLEFCTKTPTRTGKQSVGSSSCKIDYTSPSRLTKTTVGDARMTVLSVRNIDFDEYTPVKLPPKVDYFAGEPTSLCRKEKKPTRVSQNTLSGKRQPSCRELNFKSRSNNDKSPKSPSRKEECTPQGGSRPRLVTSNQGSPERRDVGSCRQLNFKDTAKKDFAPKSPSRSLRDVSSGRDVAPKSPSRPIRSSLPNEEGAAPRKSPRILVHSQAKCLSNSCRALNFKSPSSRDVVLKLPSRDADRSSLTEVASPSYGTPPQSVFQGRAGEAKKLSESCGQMKFKGTATRDMAPKSPFRTNISASSVNPFHRN